MIKKAIPTLVPIIALQVSSAAIAADVNLLCDATMIASDGERSPNTRRYILNDESKSISIITSSGNVERLCTRDPCDLDYNSTSVSFTQWVGQRNGNDYIRFDLNRITGRVVENWHFGTDRFNSTIEGTCHATAVAKPQF